jgi:hypothetical protein
LVRHIVLSQKPTLAFIKPLGISSPVAFFILFQQICEKRFFEYSGHQIALAHPYIYLLHWLYSDRQSLSARSEYLVIAGSSSRFAPVRLLGQVKVRSSLCARSITRLVRTQQQHIARVSIRSSDPEAASALARAFGSSPGPAVALRSTRILTKARIQQRPALGPSTFISGQRYSRDVSVIVRFLSWFPEYTTAANQQLLFICAFLQSVAT